MPPPLVGEALAFRDVFQQTQIGFIENEISLPRAPLTGKTPPAGGGGTQVPKGERLSPQASERLNKGRLSSERRTQVLLCTTSPTSSFRSMPPPLVGEALAFRKVYCYRQRLLKVFSENVTFLPRAPLLGELAPQASERLDKGRL